MSNEKRINKQLKLDIAFFIPLSLCKKAILIPDFTRDGRGLTNKRLSEKTIIYDFFKINWKFLFTKKMVGTYNLI